MYATYLRRELAGRKKQTAIVAVGLAVAIALVIVVNALSAGVRDAQSSALASVYGIGTDLTVTGAAAEPGQGGQRFEFGEGGPGATSNADGSTSLSQSRLTTGRMRQTIDAASVQAVVGVDGVAQATGALSLENVSFSGEIPQAPSGTDAGTGGTAQGGMPPQGGPQGGSFGIDATTVLGVDPAASGIGPLSAVTITEGRALAASDADANVAVVDASYATSNSLAVGGTIDLGGTSFEVVGIAASATDEADTASEVYIPLGVAQTLSGAGDVVSTVYVQAASAGDIEAVAAAIEQALPEAQVSTQADLASTVSGSLQSAQTLIANLGTWLSIIVLAVAVAIAVLLTLGGVTRRTREFGTLKAIGWSNRRIVSQVAGESLVQSLIGGAVGLILGIATVFAINLAAPTISVAASTSRGGAGGQGGMPGGGPAGPGFGAGVSQAASDIVLHAPLTVGIVIAAVGLAAAGGLIAGAFGGWRAARLSPAEALRAVA